MNRTHSWSTGSSYGVIPVLLVAHCVTLGGSQSPNIEGERLQVLFIGNSYTSFMQGTLNNLIRSSPFSESTLEYVTHGGWSLQQHLHSNDTLSKIKNQDWDFVVLQEQSQIPTLPDRRGEFHDAVVKLSEIIKESGAQVVLYMTWGRRDYDSAYPDINPDYETMQQRLLEAYTEAASSVDAIISPVGLAWRRVRMNRPNLGYGLYSSDGSHPSHKGTFLIACVFYATLFDADPTQLDYNGSLAAAEAAYLRGQAKEALTPNADFNGDGIVDGADVCIMIDYWGEDYPLCDIGPVFWGDGVVDVQDLIVLAENLLTYPGAVAYWTLDESEGNVAYDSIGVYDGVLSGVPTWQPTAGMVNGALQFAGIDDCVSTESVLNPAEGPFSILAWIKNGAPRQAIISQQAGANWLMADEFGCLMTELKAGRIVRGQPSEPLTSAALVADGDWHRVAFTWDGSARSLYVDDVLAAQDTVTGLADCYGGLNIGCGKDMAAGTFFTGLIDDVRIYNRAVKP